MIWKEIRLISYLPSAPTCPWLSLQKEQILTWLPNYLISILKEESDHAPASNIHQFPTAFPTTLNSFLQSSRFNYPTVYLPVYNILDILCEHPRLSFPVLDCLSLSLHVLVPLPLLYTLSYSIFVFLIKFFV